MQNGMTLEDAKRYHDALPLRVREYLNRRGITDPVIDHHLLGWNGDRITIPVHDREGRLSFFRLAKDREDTSPAPKMLGPAGAPVELYGWERVNAKPCRIVICEGEFDRLVLEAQGIPAVTSTGGAGVFREEWAAAFGPISEVFICFDHDAAGRRGGLRVARLIPNAKVVQLPEELGEGGDVTDFFVRLGCGRGDFLRLLLNAKPLSPEDLVEPPIIYPGRSRTSYGRDVDEAKAAAPIEEVIGRYIKLRRSGATLTGRCLFHMDRTPSLVVFPETQSFYCFGCQIHGDALSFLMEVENLTFPEALKVLRKLAE